MAWQVIITEKPIVENGMLIIRSILTDSVSQKVPDEYRSQDFSVQAYKDYLNSKLLVLSKQPSEIDPSLVPGVFDPLK